jgi:hypothetical protein
MRIEASPRQPDPAILSDLVHETVSPSLRRGESIDSVSWSRSKFSSSYECFVIDVTVSADRRLKLLLKDFGYSRLLKDDPDRRRDRELYTYRDLLPEADLGTARYYGSIWDLPNDRHWLLLEFVEGVEVRSLPLEYWVAAVGWLGKLHGKFAQQGEMLAQMDFLIRRDAGYYEAKAQEALTIATAVAPSLSDRIESLVRSFTRVISDIAYLPRTLVHGSIGAPQIIVDCSAAPIRIAPVDWESAAYGSGFQDVAKFTDGFEPPLLDDMFEAYVREASEHGLIVDRREMGHAVDSFRLLRMINGLAQARRKGYKLKDVTKVVNHGEEIARSLICQPRRGAPGGRLHARP